MPFRYLIGFPLGSWIIRKAIVPSVEVAGNILTGTRTRERRRLPDQTGMGAMAITRKQYSLSRIWGGRWPLQVNKDGTARKLPRNPLMGRVWVLIHGTPPVPPTPPVRHRCVRSSRFHDKVHYQKQTGINRAAPDRENLSLTACRR